MKSLFKIHPIQVNIITYLTWHPHARYTDLNTTKITTDHFNFHLTRLLEYGLIEKNGDGKYSLTQDGKKMINTLATGSQLLFDQYKIVVLVVCKAKIEGVTKFLLQKRQKEPFFGIYDLLSGKVQWEETTQDAAERIFKEKTSLSLVPTFSHIKHKIDKDKKGAIIENKFLYIYTVNLSGPRVKKIQGQNLLWADINELQTLESIFPDIPMIIQSKKQSYEEIISLASHY
ncbi:MAG TPA: NUDIX domain-containing protein [Candidatus Eisenbacteria bacterium]|nr:NUDIX domain-containing protein [Candidatus Eisenbacteria bacterium]